MITRNTKTEKEFMKVLGECSRARSWVLANVDERKVSGMSLEKISNLANLPSVNDIWLQRRMVKFPEIYGNPGKIKVNTAVQTADLSPRDAMKRFANDRLAFTLAGIAKLKHKEEQIKINEELELMAELDDLDYDVDCF